MRIAVLGVGLIGGSIGLAARARAGRARSAATTPTQRVLARALELGAIDRAADGVAEAVADADVVFVAAPVGALAATVRQALAGARRPTASSATWARPSACSPTRAPTSASSAATRSRAPRRPGVEHAREDLFEGAVWYLTPAPSSTAGVLYERLHRLLTAIGAQPDRDRRRRPTTACWRASRTCRTCSPTCSSPRPRARSARAPSALPAVGPSFRDATRVAGANSAIWTDIYIVQPRRAGRRRSTSSRGARGGARRRSPRATRRRSTAWNERARADRDALLGAGLAGGPVHELRASVPNRPGVIAEIALALGQRGRQHRRHGALALRRTIARASSRCGSRGERARRARRAS